jgi:twinfilin-like protein
MLFASTRLTLTRELGTEHFRETIFATTADDLSAKGFERHDAHARLEAPLTEEERSLGEVKRAEAEAGSGTGTREIHLSKNLAMPVGEEAVAALKELGQEGGRRGAVMLVSDISLILSSVRIADGVATERKSTPKAKSSS